MLLPNSKLKFTNVKFLPALCFYGVTCLFATPPSFASAARDLEESLSSVQSKALDGDNYYQGILALFYKYGEKELAIQPQEAERWAKIAAKNGGGIGMAVLASIELEKGNTDRGQFLYDEAYLHSNLRDLAKTKNPFALFCIGLMEIDNPPSNISKGVRNIESSARMGFASAQATLGVIMLTGSGIERNQAEAIKWCSMSARQKLPLGMFYLGMAYSFGDGVPKNQDYANRWIRAAADRELVTAQLTLGMKLALGDGIEKNLGHGVAWLKKAQSNGSAEAEVQLRRFETLLRSNRKPSSQPKKKIKPVGNIQERIENHSTEVSREIGLKNYKVKKYSEAKKHFLRAAEDSDPISLRYLGIMHFLGQEVDRDYVEAKTLLKKAQVGGDQEAGRYLEVIERMSQ